MDETQPFNDVDPWMLQGNCRLYPPKVFFPSDGVGVDKARKICSGCPVAERCLSTPSSTASTMVCGAAAANASGGASSSGDVSRWRPTTARRDLLSRSGLPLPDRLRRPGASGSARRRAGAVRLRIRGAGRGGVGDARRRTLTLVDAVLELLLGATEVARQRESASPRTTPGRSR